MACLGREDERFVLRTRGGAVRFDNENGLGEAVGVEEEGRSGACRGQEKERLVLRTKGEAARVQQKRNSGAHSRMYSRTHKNTPTIAHAHTIPARKDGGEDSGYLLV